MCFDKLVQSGCAASKLAWNIVLSPDSIASRLYRSLQKKSVFERKSTNKLPSTTNTLLRAQHMARNFTNCAQPLESMIHSSSSLLVLAAGLVLVLVVVLLLLLPLLLLILLWRQSRLWLWQGVLILLLLHCFDTQERAICVQHNLCMTDSLQWQQRSRGRMGVDTWYCIHFGQSLFYIQPYFKYWSNTFIASTNKIIITTPLQSLKSLIRFKLVTQHEYSTGVTPTQLFVYTE